MYFYKKEKKISISLAGELYLSDQIHAIRMKNERLIRIFRGKLDLLTYTVNEVLNTESW